MNEGQETRETTSGGLGQVCRCCGLKPATVKARGGAWLCEDCGGVFEAFFVARDSVGEFPARKLLRRAAQELKDNAKE